MHGLDSMGVKTMEELKSGGVYVLAIPLLPSCANSTNLNLVQDHYSALFAFENVKQDLAKFIIRLEDQC